MKCTACEKELTRKEALYTIDKLPYCPNPFDCTTRHPNHVENILARQGAVKMFTEDQLETNIFENLNVTPEMRKRIMKVATKPQSIRLFKVDIAYYVLQLQESKQLSSISEAVRYCIEQTMEREPLTNTVETFPDESSSDIVEDSRGFIIEPEPVKPAPVVKKPTVKVVPKVKDLIMQQIDNKQKDEDELVF